MNQPIFFDSDVYESTERSNICDDSRQHHSNLDIFDCFQTVIKIEHFCLFSWVVTRFFQFRNNILECECIHIREEIRGDLFQQVGISNEFLCIHLYLFGHFLHEMITFWMD